MVRECLYSLFVLVSLTESSKEPAVNGTSGFQKVRSLYLPITSIWVAARATASTRKMFLAPSHYLGVGTDGISPSHDDTPSASFAESHRFIKLQEH